jgi:hypothetical protein
VIRRNDVLGNGQHGIRIGPFDGIMTQNNISDNAILGNCGLLNQSGGSVNAPGISGARPVAQGQTRQTKFAMIWRASPSLNRWRRRSSTSPTSARQMISSGLPVASVPFRRLLLCGR